MVKFDEFGPEKILQVYHPKTGMKGWVVIDNIALGPGKGGIRMTPTVSMEEVADLARTMTWKNALAELPFGGAKSGILADDRKISAKEKEDIIKAFAKAISIVAPDIYIAAPDINTGEPEMKIIAKTLNKKAVTGKPKKMGGLPHELGSTGFGVFIATKIAVKHKKLNLEDLTFAVEGFGNVGWFAAKFLTEAGAKFVAVSDSRGTIYNEKGLDFKKVAEVKKNQKTVTAYKEKGTKALHNSEIISVKADILITAAIPNLIDVKDVDKIKAQIIVEGSNLPIKPHTEELLYHNKVLVVPDFVANAGGVISSYVEYIGGTEKEMFKLVEEKISKNTKIVLEESKKNKEPPRKTALRIAKKRVLDKCAICKIPKEFLKK